MGRDALPGEVHALVARYFKTSSDVDVVLLLHYHRGPWSTRAVAGRLHLHPDPAQGILDRLAASGLLHRDTGGYRYEPVHPAASAAVDRLATLHPSYRIAILTVIFDASRTTGRLGPLAASSPLEEGDEVQAARRPRDRGHST